MLAEDAEVGALGQVLPEQAVGVGPPAGGQQHMAADEAGRPAVAGRADGDPRSFGRQRQALGRQPETHAAGFEDLGDTVGHVGVFARQQVGRTLHPVMPAPKRCIIWTNFRPMWLPAERADDFATRRRTFLLFQISSCAALCPAAASANSGSPGVSQRHEPDVGEMHHPYLIDLIGELGWFGPYEAARGTLA